MPRTIKRALGVPALVFAIAAILSCSIPAKASAPGVFTFTDAMLGPISVSHETALGLFKNCVSSEHPPVSYILRAPNGRSAEFLLECNVIASRPIQQL